MRQTVRLGRVAGIPVGIHWSVLVIMLLLAQVLAVSILPAGAPGLSAVVYWAVALVVTALFLLALLAHEMSHALVARRFGVRVRRITLWLLGGVAELDGEAPHARGDLLIALAGPATSMLCALAFGAATAVAEAVGASALAVAALAWLAVVNAVLAVFNLLPGAPLDGGRVLRAALWWIRGDRVAAQRAASFTGMVLGWVLAFAGLSQLLLAGDLSGLWLVLVGWFLAAAARAEDADARVKGALVGVRVGEIMSSPPVYGVASQTIDNFISAVVRRHPYRVFPVLDLDGRLTGIVSLAQLSRVPGPRRATARLAEVQTPVARIVVLDPATPLTDVAAPVLAAGHRLAPVLVHGRLTGVVTATDITRSLELASLGALPNRTVVAEPPSQVGPVHSG